MISIRLPSLAALCTTFIFLGGSSCESATQAGKQEAVDLMLQVNNMRVADDATDDQRDAAIASTKPLLQKICDLDGPDLRYEDEDTLLHLAASSNLSQFLTLLRTTDGLTCQATFKFNAANADKMTPLQLAAQKRNVKAVEQLLQVPSVKDNKELKGGEKGEKTALGFAETALALCEKSKCEKRYSDLISACEQDETCNADTDKLTDLSNEKEKCSRTTCHIECNGNAPCISDMKAKVDDNGKKIHTCVQSACIEEAEATIAALTK